MGWRGIFIRYLIKKALWNLGKSLCINTDKAKSKIKFVDYKNSETALPNLYFRAESSKMASTAVLRSFFMNLSSAGKQER